ncbi:uncharacterized protein LOC143238172 [Tachypleus tridentatus]|uniref:uncharacterized protein LOC143238172 n=1 Tax=Tachypleus tridentatus TaxID=6853 RepID=UPI003FD2B999
MKNFTVDNILKHQEPSPVQTKFGILLNGLTSTWQPSSNVVPCKTKYLPPDFHSPYCLNLYRRDLSTSNTSVFFHLIPKDNQLCPDAMNPVLASGHFNVPPLFSTAHMSGSYSTLSCFPSDYKWKYFNQNHTNSMSNDGSFNSYLLSLNLPSVNSTNRSTHDLPGKPRRPRSTFSKLQLQELEKQFMVKHYLSRATRYQLAEELMLTETQIKIWFQNRRMKWRKTRASESVSDKEAQGSCLHK